MVETRVHIIQPAPWGPGRGLFSATEQRNLKDRRVCFRPTPAPPRGDAWALPRLADRCAVCRTSVVEVKAPLFTSAAWQIFTEVVLGTQEPEALTCDTGLD